MVPTNQEWKLLVADDDAEMRALIAQSLCLELPCIVTQAESAREAIHLLRKSDFHLIVSDISMDDSGLDILRFLKDQRLNIPVLFFTGTNIDFPHSPSGPFFTFIQKPKVEELMACVRDRLEVIKR